MRSTRPSAGAARSTARCEREPTKKLRAAVDSSVHFINAFEGLKCLPSERDAVLKTP